MPTNIYTVEIDGRQYDLEGDHPPSEAEARGAIGATTPKQATAPPAAATAGMMKPNTPNDSTFPTPDQLLNKWQESPALVARGARDVTRGNIAKGGNEMLGGAATFTAPVTIPATLGAAALAPVATAVGVGSGLLGGAASGATARKLGATPDQADLAQNLGGIAAGGLTARAYNNGPGIVEGLKQIGGISKIRAGGNIQAATQAAGAVPLNTEGVGQSGLRAMELQEAGGRMPRVVSMLMRRVTDPDQPDLTFAEARDYYSNLSRLSANEFGSLNPTMQRQVGAMRQALHEALTSAADTVGAGDQYASGMSEYAKAGRAGQYWDKNLKPLLGSLAKDALKGSALAGGGYEVWKRLNR